MSKTTTITKLAIHNFKGIANQLVEFNEDRPTVISGRNGTGKTTIADAYTWLLWGLNSEDQQTANFGIKPNDKNGNVRLDLNPEVEGWLRTIDNETGELTEIRLKRRWTGVWRTKSGEVEPEFVRNKGEYFIDDIPVKEAEYKAAVESIIPPEIFKCITNPFYFPRLRWQDKREILLQMAGDVTIEDVARRAPEFEALLAELSGKTLDDYIKKYATQIARINTELAQIPVRIQEAERATPQAPDYAALETEKIELEARARELEKLATNASEAERARTKEQAEILQQIREKQSEQGRVLGAAQNAEQKRVREANAERTKIAADLQQARNAISDRIADIDSRGYALRKRVDTLNEQIADLTRRQDDLRKEWYRENEKQYTAGATLNCPITGAPCQDPATCAAHAQSWEQAQKAFNDTQTAKKNAITEKGKKLGAEIADKQAEVAKADKELQDLRAERQSLTSAPDPKVAELEAKLAKTTAATVESIKPESLPRWVELQNEIAQLNDKLKEAPAAEDQTDLMSEMRRINNRIMAIGSELGVKTTIEQQRKRIKELQESEQKLLQERAAAQKKLATADRLTKERMTAVEERVNKLFTLVRFQMFEPTATTGDEKPGCTCWVGEAKYGDKNKAGKVNAGLDIINAFCRYHGVRAPIFIDNAESVNDFILTESQLVLLKVSTGNFTIE